MAEAFPDSPPAERQRFLDARDQNFSKASELLRKHLAFRAASLPPPADQKLIDNGLPHFLIDLADAQSLDGSKVIVAVGAMLDPSFGTPYDYAVATAAFLDPRFPRDSMKRMTLIVDVDGVAGGANAPPTKLMAILREFARVLGNNFPERLEKMIVYPVPAALRWLWTAIKFFLDPVTAAKTVLLPGSSTPMNELKGLERARHPKEIEKYIDVQTMPDSPLYGYTGPRRVGEPPPCPAPITVERLRLRFGNITR
uniref:CRAL-TRIO domain-containing protein n=1 Tax=Haptolina brevifila TaxID=156173 RepID=A0A7S2HZQ1_9EUKA